MGGIICRVEMPTVEGLRLCISKFDQTVKNIIILGQISFKRQQFFRRMMKNEG